MGRPAASAEVQVKGSCPLLAMSQMADEAALQIPFFTEAGGDRPRLQCVRRLVSIFQQRAKEYTCL